MSEEDLGRLRAALRQGIPLRLAMLFGSASKGQLRADGDVDIAVLPAGEEPSLRAELDLQAALSRACGRPAGASRRRRRGLR
ncbi:MAG: nucleotidyltransferase domain-containing protein [Candidatus Riflebacteria bacterium]|nr:nucleotidyltransferase domain-containing protein [Candidatus Riflebacteria bacterium]